MPRKNPPSVPIDGKSARRLEALLRQYSTVVEAADLAPSSKAMYIDFANCFLRWMKGEFEPGIAGGRARQVKPFTPSS